MPQNPLDFLTDTPDSSVPSASSPPVPQDASDAIRKMLEDGVQDTPHAALLRALHMTPDETAKRSKLGNLGQVGGNFLQALIGRNFRTEANQDYAAQTPRLQLGATELRNDDLVKKADADRLLREKLGKDLADSKAFHEKTMKDIADQKDATAQQKLSDEYQIKADKNDIASAWNDARTGTAKAKQASIDKFNEYKMKHPNERPESFIANALTEASPDGKLSIPEYQSALNDFYKSQSLRQGPMIRNFQTPTFDPSGKQDGSRIDTAITNRQTGQTSVNGAGGPSTPGAPPTPSNVIPFGPTGGGSAAVSPAAAKEIPGIETARTSAYQSAQNLLQDFGSGKINDYTGWMKGSGPAKWARNQGYMGGVSSGEALMGLLSPENTIRNIRSMSPRINQTEIIKFDGAHGTQSMSGQSLVERGMIYAMEKDYQLASKMGTIPKISDGKGGATPINETPEFIQALRETIDSTAKAATKSKGMVVKAPTFNDVVALAKQKIASGLQQTLRDITPPPSPSPELDELKKRGIL